MYSTRLLPERNVSCVIIYSNSFDINKFIVGSGVGKFGEINSNIGLSRFGRIWVSSIDEPNNFQFISSNNSL
jgi:hypothetical protein